MRKNRWLQSTEGIMNIFSQSQFNIYILLKNNSIHLLVSILLSLFSAHLFASEGNRLSLVPTGRILVDAGGYLNGSDTLRGELHFYDVRMGLKENMTNITILK